MATRTARRPQVCLEILNPIGLCGERVARCSDGTCHPRQGEDCDTCAADCGCAAGSFCGAGACVQCRSQADCAAGELCDQGACTDVCDPAVGCPTGYECRAVGGAHACKEIVVVSADLGAGPPDAAAPVDAGGAALADDAAAEEGDGGSGGGGSLAGRPPGAPLVLVLASLAVLCGRRSRRRRADA